VNFDGCSLFPKIVEIIYSNSMQCNHTFCAYVFLRRAAAKYPNNNCLGVRPFVLGADGKYSYQAPAAGADEKEEKKAAAKQPPTRGDYVYINYQQVCLP
jgi:hypothetical protein